MNFSSLTSGKGCRAPALAYLASRISTRSIVSSRKILLKESITSITWPKIV